MRAIVGRALIAFVILLVQPLLLALPASAGDGANAEGGCSGRFVPDGAVVLFDEAHYPVYTVNPNNPSGYASGNQAEGAYSEFAKVLEKAGLKVKTLDFGYSLDSSSLAGVKVLVIVCSQGKGPNDAYETAPYSQAETDAVLNFVLNGGGLFLIGDHTTFPPAIFPVADRFGITYGEKLLHDPEHFVYNSSSNNPPEGDVFIYFERHNMNGHPIMNNISRVELYRTDIFSSLPGDAVPLITSDNDTYYEGNGGQVQAPYSVVSAAIPSNGTAGAGRVVVVADTNTFETDENRDDDGDMDLYDSDNELYGLQIVEWLADVPEHFGVDLVSAEPDSPGSKNLVHDCNASTNTTFYIRLENAGNVPDIFDLTVTETTNLGWAHTMSHGAVALKSAESSIMTLKVTVPSDAAIGDACRFTIRANSRTNLTTIAFLNCTAQIAARHRLSLLCQENSLEVKAGKEATFQLTLANKGNIREAINLTLEAAQNWEMGLDLNATELEPGDSLDFGLDVTPPADAMGGDEALVTVRATPASLPSANVSVDTLTTVIHEYGIRLGCSLPVQEANPGSLVSFPVSVTNLGNGPDEVTLSLVGGSKWATYIEPTHLSLPYNSTLFSTVVTRAPAGSPANETLEIDVVGASVLNGTARDNVSLKAVVRMVNGFLMDLSPPTEYVDPGGKGTFNLTIKNTGNTPERVKLSLQQSRGLSTEEVSLGIGEMTTVPLEVPVGQDEEAWTKHIINVTGVSAINASARRSVTATLVVNQLHRIRGELDPSELTLRPGEEGRSLLSVRNEGNGPEVASAFLDGLPGGWRGGPENTSLGLGRGDFAVTPVTVTVQAGTPMGTYNLELNLSDGVGNIHHLPLTVRVLQVHNFSLATFPESVRTTPGKSVNCILYVRNFGNGPETVGLSAPGKLGGWLKFEQDTPSANRSSEVQLQLTVRPGPDATPGKYRITITGKGADNTTREVSLTVVIVERATTRDDTPCLIAVLLILLAAVGAYAASRKAKQAEKERELLEAKRLAEADERPPRKSGGLLVEQTARKESLRKKQRKKGRAGRPRIEA